jgi:hypothetical protein
MKTVDTHGSFDEALSTSSSQVQEIADGLRKLIIEVYPDVVEVPWPKQKIIGYGVGPKKMSEHFYYIGAFKEHVNLGFFTVPRFPIRKVYWKARVRTCGTSKSARTKRFLNQRCGISFNHH